MEPIKVKPSQIPNIVWMLISIAFTVVFAPIGIIMLIIGLYYMIETSMHSYIFHENYMEEVKGVFTTTQRRVNYFRIKSVVLEKPILLTMVGLGNVIINTSEPWFYKLKIRYIFVSDELYYDLSEGVKDIREKMGIKEYDIHTN